MNIEEWTRAVVEELTHLHAKDAPREMRAVGTVLRRLSDPACYGSESVLAQIRWRRAALRARARGVEVAAIFGDEAAAESQDGEEESP